MFTLHNSRLAALLLPCALACGDSRAGDTPNPPTSAAQDASPDAPALEADADVVPDTATPDAATPDPDARPDDVPRRLLWVGAHPDDETTASPVLGHYCVEEGWDCTLLIATHGESGSCHLPDNCQPDLRTVRLKEALDAAAIFNAELIHWDLGNSPNWEPYAGDVEERLAAWAEVDGSFSALVERFRRAIVDINPTQIFTMDPRHGNTCHPEHRAAAALVVLALDELGEEAPPAYMVQTRFGGVNVAPDTSEVEWFDASRYAPSIDATLYAFIPLNWRAHPSQQGFSIDEMDTYVATMPSDEQRVGLLELKDATRTDGPRWDDLCPPSTF